MRKLLSLFVVAILLSSCSTALHVASVQPSYAPHSKPKMEFIGFKNIAKNHFLLGKFGAELERQGIAQNRQDFYMGVYSLQELDVYKSSMRYVAFADISNVYSQYDDNIRDKQDLFTAGWIVAGITCFTLFPVYVPMVLAANQNYCQLDVCCNCTMYIYDTLAKEIVLSVPVAYRDTQVFKGQYRHKETDVNAVTERARTLIYNELLTYFDRAYRFIDDLEKNR